jgi:hypothetical protein
LVPGHGPETRTKCFALCATTDTPSEERRLDGLALAAIDGPGPPNAVRPVKRLWDDAFFLEDALRIGDNHHLAGGLAEHEFDRGAEEA